LDSRATPPSAERRARRAPGEIHDLILDAARRSFNERGYARATTRDIAARAEVNETLLFRNFGSKANLFAEAVLEPMADFLSQWLELTDPSTDAVSDLLQERFTDSLYASVTENRGMLLTFFATSVFEPEVLAGHAATTRVEGALDDLADACEERLVRLGVDTSEMDVRISARATIAMILGVALFEEWLLPHGAHRPSRSEVVEELTRQILFGGFNERPDAFRESARSRTRTGRAARSTGARSR
jgi:AcrR family transcriptional regulator